MNRESIQFNYKTPRQWTDENGTVRYMLPRTGDTMVTSTMDDMIKYATNVSDKAGKLWFQMFNSGSRTGHDNIDWNTWNGCVYIDVDSKHYYNEVKPFDTDNTERALDSYFTSFCSNNYFCMQKSAGGQGYHIFFYYDVPKSEDNYRKCVMISKKSVYDAWCHIGKEDVVKYPKVMDNCTSSPYQGAYMTTQQMWWGFMCDNKDEFGKFEGLDEMTCTDCAERFTKGVRPTIVDGKDTFTLKRVKNVDTKDLTHDDHIARWCTYDALVMVFKDKDKVDAEWARICEMMPPGKHDKTYYLNEPERNGWFKRFKRSGKTSVKWLRKYGYEIDIRNEYVFQKEFENNWRHSCMARAYAIFLDSAANRGNIENRVREEFAKWLGENAVNGNKVTVAEKNAKYKELDEQVRKEIIDGIKGKDIMDKVFDHLGTDEDYKDGNIPDIDRRMDEVRDEYFKTVYEIRDFDRIAGKYAKEKDKNGTAYEMFADLYYRDKNGMPTLLFNYIEEDIELTEGSRRDANSSGNAVMSYGDEFVKWCNCDMFSNKMKKDMFKDAVEKFAVENLEYNPLRDYLKRVSEDVKPDVEKMETFFIRHLGAPDRQVIRSMTRNFFCAAVKKQMMDDPCELVFEHILFLVGPTNNNKTMALTALFSPERKRYFHNDVNPNMSDKEMGPLIRKNWMIQFGESAALKKADANTQKEFVDRLNLPVKFQPKFKNEMHTVRPRVVMTRTSNDDILFNDASISECDKRNWLIPCLKEANSSTEENRKEIRDEVNMVWSTAMHLIKEDADRCLELTPDEWNELAEIQEPHKLVRNDDIEELYNMLFERKYLVNEREEIKVEKWIEYMKGSEDDMKPWSDPMYSYPRMIWKFPMRYLQELCGKNNVNTVKLLRRLMERNGWKTKNIKYAHVTTKCWYRDDPNPVDCNDPMMLMRENEENELPI